MQSKVVGKLVLRHPPPATLLEATTDVDAGTAFFLLWPLAIGRWLLVSGAPFPTYLSDEDLAAAAATESQFDTARPLRTRAN